MRAERQEKSPVKICPYWARYAEVPNGWVVAHCSYTACQIDNEEGKIWEGPPKSKNCELGFSTTSAISAPSIVIHNPELPCTEMVDSPVVLSGDEWNRCVEISSLYLKETGYSPTPYSRWIWKKEINKGLG